MEKNKVKVIIGGTEYTLVTPEQAEYVQRVAILVDKKISEITEYNPHLSTAMSAMLTAINLSDDYLKLESASDNLRNQVAEYSKNEHTAKSQLDEKTKQLGELEQKVQELEREVQDLKIELAKTESNHKFSKQQHNKQKE